MNDTGSGTVGGLVQCLTMLTEEAVGLNLRATSEALQNALIICRQEISTARLLVDYQSHVVH